MSLLSVMQADLPGGLWTLNDTADSSGNANTLTEISAPPRVTSIIPAVSTQAIDFDGVADTVFAADHATLDLGDAFTLEAWINPDAFGSSIIYKNDSYELFAGGASTFGLSRPNVGVLVLSTVTLSAGVTSHCVGTKNGSTVNLYLNGVDVTGTVTNSTCVNTANRLDIGSSVGATAWFNGRVQYAAVYPTALTQTRVQAHYNAGLSSDNFSPFPPLGRGASW